ncbi:MAG: hypothetical protein ACXVGN_00020 [Mycobacteriaceae bacterium]
MSNMTDTMTASRWLEQYDITFDWSANGYQIENGWEHHAYTITLRKPLPDHPELHTGLDLPWRQGLGVDDEPTPESVLWAVASDVQYGALDWDDFAREFGYDELDAKLSEYRSWEACRELHQKVYDFCTSQAMFEDFCNIQEVVESD